MMKAKRLTFLLVVSLVFVTNCPCVQAQNISTDKQAIAMLREFYTTYITEWSKLTTPINLTKLHAVQKRYCTVNLMSKINAQLKSGHLEADPFLQAQDVDISWLKTMYFNKDLSRLNGYIVSYVIEPVSNEKAIIHLTVIKQGHGLKIASVR